MPKYPVINLDAYSFDACKDPESIKQALIELNEKYNERVFPGITMSHCVDMLLNFPGYGYLIRLSSNPDSLTLSYIITRGQIRHTRFENTAINDPSKKSAVENARDLFVNATTGLTIVNFIDTRVLNSQLKMVLSNPESKTEIPKKRADENTPIMIVSTQVAADGSTADDIGIRLGGTGESINTHIGGGLIHMHRDKSVNRNDIKILTQHLKPNGLLIITGHGSDGANEITGGYCTAGPDPNPSVEAIESTETVKNIVHVKHSAEDYVNAVLQANTLPPGSLINLLLYVCHAAKKRDDDICLSRAFANSFAAHGISTNIIATTAIAGRIGTPERGYGDIVGASFTFRADFKSMVLLRTTANEDGTIQSQNEQTPTEPYIITPFGCGPRSEMELFMITYLEGKPVQPELLSSYADVLTYFLSDFARDVEHAALTNRAKALLSNLTSDQTQIVLDKIKLLSTNAHTRIHALVRSLSAASSATTFGNAQTTQATSIDNAYLDPDDIEVTQAIKKRLT